MHDYYWRLHCPVDSTTLATEYIRPLSNIAMEIFIILLINWREIWWGQEASFIPLAPETVLFEIERQEDENDGN